MASAGTHLAHACSHPVRLGEILLPPRRRRLPRLLRLLAGLGRDGVPTRLEEVLGLLTHLWPRLVPHARRVPIAQRSAQR